MAQKPKKSASLFVMFFPMNSQDYQPIWWRNSCDKTTLKITLSNKLLWKIKHCIWTSFQAHTIQYKVSLYTLYQNSPNVNILLYCSLSMCLCICVCTQRACHMFLTIWEYVDMVPRHSQSFMLYFPKTRDILSHRHTYVVNTVRTWSSIQYY